MPCRAPKESSDALGVRSGAKAIGAVQLFRRLGRPAGHMLLKVGCINWPCCTADGRTRRVLARPVLQLSIHISSTQRRGHMQQP